MPDNAPTLIIPVENQVRELDAKLLIAGAAAERGFSVVLGSQLYVHLALAQLPPGVLLAKSMRAVNATTYRLAHWYGHTIIAGDEEALVRFESPEYYPWRYSPKTFAAISHFLCWGNDDARFLQAYPGYSGQPVHVTGNARIDLLRPGLCEVFRPQVQKIIKQHGEFVLINTNFSFVNHFSTKLNLVRRDSNGAFVSVGRHGRGMSRCFADGMAQHQDAIFAGFRGLLPQLEQQFPHTRFVLRPHPSENHDVWRRLTRDLDRVSIIHDGNVVPWLMAAQCLIHNGCTTAVEAAILGTPAIAYRPVTSPQYDYRLPNSLSHEAFTPLELMDKLARLLDAYSPVAVPADCSDILSRHVAPIDGELAADQIVRVAEKAAAATQRHGLARFGGRVGLGVRKIAQRIKMAQPDHRTGRAHHAHHFPPFDPQACQARLAALGTCLGRFRSLTVRPISPWLYAIRERTR